MPQTQSQPAMSPVLRGRSQSRPMTVLERKANATDRRKSRRIKTRAWVWADYHGKQYHLRNLSLAGAFVRMEDPPRKGAKVEIRLEGERLVEPIEVAALVRRCWREHGMGVEFTRFRGVGRARLDELLASLAVARILVVDNDESVRKELSVIFQKENYYVLTAADGLEGLQMALDSQPDLILMDLDLPGMKGLELCQRLRSSPHLAQVPIVIASATSNPAYFSCSKQLGAAGFVPKPFKTQRLLSYVRMLVAR